MTKLPSLCALLLLAGTPAGPGAEFSGCILYENEYQTLAGETLYFAVKPKSWFYIQGNNFKLYDRNKQLNELYIGDANALYTFAKGQPRLLSDTARRPAPPVLTCLPTTATILGYRCHLLRLAEGRVSTLVFYAPELRVSVAAFSRCPSYGWYQLLQATDGALPLRTITVDTQHDVTATSEAIAVTPMVLPATNFTTTAPAR
ncbi:hypothetical protein GCM10023172_32790 [Hymenobacter ginsengisoli]|uniref:DUF4412 domain-containing protein n=1 Tax=Hymenobacter ginsengisoli TaxID=1051626 RepID=A0ABP8QQM9_9BACT|nr:MULTISPECIES: hypothetical protein [unclassified Hymenobacter]MBO2031183.1 hypothetical protein [Hymenobacter sp. BT559]